MRYLGIVGWVPLIPSPLITDRTHLSRPPSQVDKWSRQSKAQPMWCVLQHQTWLLDQLPRGNSHFSHLGCHDGTERFGLFFTSSCKVFEWVVELCGTWIGTQLMRNNTLLDSISDWRRPSLAGKTDMIQPRESWWVAHPHVYLHPHYQCSLI